MAAALLLMFYLFMSYFVGFLLMTLAELRHFIEGRVTGYGT
jgi:hypothetical protein